ncbi:LacI family DNA-binding transcriptional regulator [Falsiroseomonas sp. CW058]|uniref:LacI family DNA-binding transcriptional regulator n=1 Tax=Falsiroseomonas sp. CW058 TaxID=3388664 RepID=UPI003D317EC4
MKLRDFAAAIGLAPGTVSRALNGYAGVSAGTRARVLAEAERLGYRPDRLGRMLRTGRSETIGVLLSPPQGGFNNPFFVDWLEGIDRALAATPFTMIVTAAHSAADEMARLARLTATIGVEGVLFARTRREDPRIAFLEREGVPFATLGRTAATCPHPWVDIDHAVVGREAALRLAARGHRRIALLNTAEELMYSRHAMDGFREGLRQAGLDPRAAPVLHDAPTEAGGEAAMRALLARPGPRPTALLCGNDLMAAGAMRALAAAGLRAGADMAVIGCNDHPMCTMLDPPLTSFTAPVGHAGERCARLLLDLLGGAAPVAELIAPRLVARASDPPLAELRAA